VAFVTLDTGERSIGLSETEVPDLTRELRQKGEEGHALASRIEHELVKPQKLMKTSPEDRRLLMTAIENMDDDRRKEHHDLLHTELTKWAIKATPPSD
jgi:hypothetical protein